MRISAGRNAVATTTSLDGKDPQGRQRRVLVYTLLHLPNFPFSTLSHIPRPQTRASRNTPGRCPTNTIKDVIENCIHARTRESSCGLGITSYEFLIHSYFKPRPASHPATPLEPAQQHQEQAPMVSPRLSGLRTCTTSRTSRSCL